MSPATALLLGALGATVDPPAGPGAMAPRITTHDGGALLSWIEPGIEPGKGGHRVRVAAFDGAWGPARTVVERGDLFVNWADVPVVARAPDGAWVAAWLQKNGAGTYAYDVRLARSTNGGVDWTPLGAPHRDGTETEHGFVSLVPDGAGLLAVWLDGRETAKEGPMTLRAARIGATIAPSTVLDGRVCDCCSTAATRAGDAVVVAYRDRDAGEIRDISATRRTAAGWSAGAPIHVDGWEMHGCPVNGPALAADGARVAAAWFTGAGGAARVRLAWSVDGGATFGPPVDVDGRGPLGRVDAVIDGDSAIVSWLAPVPDAEGAAEVRVRRVGLDGARGAPVSVARTATARSAGVPRIARIDGDLLVAWTAPGEPTRVRATRIRAAQIPRAAPVEAPPMVRPPPARTPPARLPALAATDLDGVPRRLTAGAPTLINVWATWCEPCRLEKPALAALHARAAPLGLKIIGLSVDEDAAAVRAFVAAHPPPYPVWIDPTGALASALAVVAVPATRLYAADGRLLWSADGLFDPAEPTFARALEAALSAPAGRDSR